MKTKTITSIILATTLSFAGISYVIAGNHQGMRGGQGCNNPAGEMTQGKHHGRMNQQRMGFSQLDLTDQQQQEMKTIMVGLKGQNKRQRSDNEMLAHRADMQALIHSETFDEAQAQVLIDKQQMQKSQRGLDMLKAKHQMFQLLTDEQKVQYSELRMQRQNR